MRSLPPVLPTLTTLLAIAAIVAWQAFDLHGRNARHHAAHQQFGEALWNATDGLIVREFRGGVYEPDALRATLAEAATRFGLDRIEIRQRDGSALAATGGTRTDDAIVFEHPFVPLRPLGRGPRWQSTALTTAPAGPLMLRIAVDSGNLTAHLRSELHRTLFTTGALVLVVALLSVVITSHARRATLRTELATSRARLEGLETMRRLSAGLVHETKNPLGVVRGFAERIAQGKLPPSDLQRTANAIVQETDRTVARIDEFLLLSRPAPLRRERILVRELFDELATLLGEDFTAAGSRLQIDCDDAAIDADRDQIRRLFMNLLINAAQAVGVGDTVRLFCRKQGNSLRLGVQDDGPGIADDLRESIFEPYVSARAGGTGLGLAIARRIANDHGFTLRHEPITPSGARFVLEITA